MSDRSRSASPKRRSASPARRSASPAARRSASPARKSSPARSGSAGRRSASPPRRSASRSRSRRRSRGGSRSRSRNRRDRDRGRRRRRSYSRSRSRGRRARRHSRSRSRSRGRRYGRSPPRRSHGDYAAQDSTYGKKVYIGDLSYDTRQEDLRKICEGFGSVVDVFMPRGRDGGPRGFGFVTFSRTEEADAAADGLDGTDIDGRRVKVNIARARPPRPGDRGDFGRRAPARPSSKIYVGGLPMDTTEEDLEKVFSKFGPIRVLDLKQVQKPPLFAFVEYEDERDAADAVKGTNQTEFQGSHIRVEFAHNSR